MKMEFWEKLVFSGIMALLFSGCGFTHRDHNSIAIRNNEIGTPKSVLLSQLLEPTNGFNCRTVATIASENYEKLEACNVIWTLSLGQVQNNNVFFYKEKFVGTGDLNKFPVEFANTIAAGKVKKIENKPIPSTISDIPQKPTIESESVPKQILKSSGSGFYINKEGFIVTNFHVVNDCSNIIAATQGKEEHLTLISTDPVNDLAVLQDETKVSNYGKFRSGNGIQTGSEIAVIGYPLKGLLASGPTSTFGYISALRGIRDNSSRIQISAPIQSGNSGGPVLDDNGDIVGVVVSSVSDKYLYEKTGTIPQNVNFAINGLLVRTFLETRGIDLVFSSGKRNLSKPEIVEKGISFTTQILCY